MSDDYLWALDLDERELPWQAHLIVDPAVPPEDGAWPKVLIAACGEQFTMTHSRGWAGSTGTGLPLAEHAIHCGADLVRAVDPTAEDGQ